MNALERARRHIANLADKDGEHQFAREVLGGCWDHRRDVQAALRRFEREAEKA